MLLLSWLALRGTQPRQRVPIIAALHADHHRLPLDEANPSNLTRVNRARRGHRLL
jgi:hypothetical protein